MKLFSGKQKQVIKKKRAYIIAASALCLLYGIWMRPGWQFYDSDRQWRVAMKIAAHSFQFDLRPDAVNNHWPLTNTLLKWLWLKLSLTPEQYNCVQAAILGGAFFSSLLFLTRHKTLLLSAILGLLVLFHPLVRNHQVFCSSDTLTAAGLLLLSVLIFHTRKPRENKKSLAKKASLISVVGLFRFNTSISFGLLGLASLPLRSFKNRSLALVGAMFLVLFSECLLTTCFQVTEEPSYAEGLGLRNCAFYKRDHDPELRKSLEGFLIDFNFPLVEDCYYTYWCEPFMGGNTRTLTKDISRQLAEAHFLFFLRHPFLWTKFSIPFWVAYLGISRPLNTRELGKTDFTFDLKFPGKPDRARREQEAATYFKESYRLHGALVRPWFLFVLVGGLWLLCYLGKNSVSQLRRQQIQYEGLCLLIAATYYAPFLLTGMYTEVRYFFPSLLLLLLVLVRQASFGAGRLFRLKT